MFNAFYVGYSNSTLFCNFEKDHAYVGFPFVFGEDYEEGFILSDPTSDQLFKDKNNALKNNIFVVKGREWSYSGDGWKDGAELFPSGDGAFFLNLGMVRSNPCRYKRGYDINKYFKNVFENVVEVDVGLK